MSAVADRLRSWMDSETSDERRRRRQRMRADAAAMQSLVKHPAWPRFVALVEERAAGAEAIVLGQMPVPTKGDPQGTFAERQGWMLRGEANALRSVLRLPHQKIEEAARLGRPEEADDRG